MQNTNVVLATTDTNAKLKEPNQHFGFISFLFTAVHPSSAIESSMEARLVGMEHEKERRTMTK